MGIKVGSSCLNWCQPSFSHSPSSLASSISSPSSKRRNFSSGDGALECRYVHGLGRSAFVGFSTSKLFRTGPLEHPKPRGREMIRVCSASFEFFSDEQFPQEIEELMKFQLSANDDDENENSSENIASLNGVQDIDGEQVCETRAKFVDNRNLIELPEPPDWPERDKMILHINVERKANSLAHPLSIRMIKRKRQWQEGVREAGQSAYCSVNRAFSSMVFIIRELHSYSLQMREMLFYEDLQGIIARVQKEIHASFVWLFQQVFSHTPTLMVYLMILLANYSVYSMANNAAIAAATQAQPYAVTTESIAVADEQSHGNQKFDSPNIKTVLVSFSCGKVASIGGNNGSGGKYRRVVSGSDGEGSFDRVSSYYHGQNVPDGASTIWKSSRTSDEESVSEQVTIGGELALWNSVVEEASKMQAGMRDEALDHETMKIFVSPVNAKIELSDNSGDYHRTELLYQMGIAEEPNNTLLLTNYAQFLCLVYRDYDRADEYFKKAVKVEPKDAEALNKYANFLWLVRKDLWAAEQSYLEAIDADPNNSYYASNYAHFLWNNGGDDTCYPDTEATEMLVTLCNDSTNEMSEPDEI